MIEFDGSAGDVEAAGESRRRIVWPVLIGVALVAGVTAAAIGALALTDAVAMTGLPDLGPATSYGLPFVRGAAEIAAALAIGNFLFAAFLVPPQPSGVLDADGYRALRLGGVACAVWATCAALLVALTVSDVSGVPLSELSVLEIWSAASLVEITAAWRWTAVLAAVVAVASVPVLRWSWTPALLAGALVTLVPLGLSGHSSSGSAHDIATNSLLIHLAAGALWAGGLLALLAHAFRRGSHTDVAARRFSALALWCFVAMALSGVINAAVRIAPTDILDTNYGLLVVGKAAALCGLGVIGWRQRRSALAALHSDPSARGPLLRLALTEAALFGVTFGVAVGLGRTPPPPALSEPTPAEVAIGFDLAEPPTLARVLFDWRFDLVFGTAAIVLAVIYLAAVYRLRRRGASWSTRRTGFWVSGCTAMLFATSSGLGSYMSAMFSVHIIVQLILTMVVPMLLVLGAPVTLALHALRAAGHDAPPGPREWLISAARSSLARFLTHPATALVAFVGGVYALYFAGVFDTAVGDHAAHVLMNGYALLSGALFFWVVFGVEPSSRPVSMSRRVAVAFAALLSYVWLGIVVRDMMDVFGESFYRSLQLDWRTELLADQKLGGVIASAGGALALLIAVAVLILTRNGNPRTADQR